MSLADTTEPYHVRRKGVVETVVEAINAATADLTNLALDLHAHPELCFQEHYAHDALTAFMAKQAGFTVERHICGLETAWSASFEQGRGGPCIGFNSEMDALPGLGHACGHQLIAIGGVAMAVGVARALREHDIAGRVLLLGTPAEEDGGGKVVLLEQGAYKSMAACLMLHPAEKGTGAKLDATNAKRQVKVEYRGKPAHAGGNPAGGVNALDAAVIAYTAISALRQQTDDSARIHGVMGGEATWACNIIPSYASMTFGVRHPQRVKAENLMKRVLACFEAGALATGCTYTVTEEQGYDQLHCSTALGEAFKEVAEDRYRELGYKVSSGGLTTASTDFGQVTFACPALHPLFHLPDASPIDFPHSATYTATAALPSSTDACLRAATALAIVGLRVVDDAAFRERVRTSWEAQMEEQKTLEAAMA